jgi:hypothetical protein
MWKIHLLKSRKNKIYKSNINFKNKLMHKNWKQLNNDHKIICIKIKYTQKKKKRVRKALIKIRIVTEIKTLVSKILKNLAIKKTKDSH